jgi:hypothetical protein
MLLLAIWLNEPPVVSKSQKKCIKIAGKAGLISQHTVTFQQRYRS